MIIFQFAHSITEGGRIELVEAAGKATPKAISVIGGLEYFLVPLTDVPTDIKALNKDIFV